MSDAKEPDVLTAKFVEKIVTGLGLSDQQKTDLNGFFNQHSEELPGFGKFFDWNKI